MPQEKVSETGKPFWVSILVERTWRTETEDFSYNSVLDLSEKQGRTYIYFMPFARFEDGAVQFSIYFSQSFYVIYEYIEGIFNGVIPKVCNPDIGLMLL